MRGNCEHNYDTKVCQSCDRNRRRRINLKYFLTDLWCHLRTRCENKTNESNLKYYSGRKYCSKEEFSTKFLHDTNFIELHNKWVQLDCELKFTPSVDRINKNLDYTSDNIQIITYSLNAGKDKEKLPILMYDLDGNFIREWESKWEAHKALGIPNGNLVKACYGERKSAGGYIWKFKL